MNRLTLTSNRNTKKTLTFTALKKKSLRTLSASLLLLVVAEGVQAQEGLEYSVRLAADGETYEVVMRPTQTPTPDMTLTAQMTLKVPHASGDKGFKMDAENNYAWTEVAHIEAPAEAPEFDYISLAYNNPKSATNAFAWKAGQEQVVLRFRNQGVCLGEVSIMANDDPFNRLPNSVQTNPGNQFTNLGWGNVAVNHFVGVYGESADCSALKTAP